jgi:DHA1 family bicyclomycin/chloramphenicol resistance-like MFS transporter
MSLVAVVFMIVPVVAPSIGQLILLFGPWQAIFWAFGAYGLIIGLWSVFRLPETLAPENRRTLGLADLRDGAFAVVSDRQSVGYTLAQTALFSGLLAYISSIQQIVFDVFREPQLIGLVFAGVAAPMALASFTNSQLVGRYGLRRVAHVGVVAFASLSLTHAMSATFIGEDLVGFMIGQTLVLSSFSFCSSNMNTLAMEKMAPVAGMASSIQGVTSTIIAAIGRLPDRAGIRRHAVALPVGAFLMWVYRLAAGAGDRLQATVRAARTAKPRCWHGEAAARGVKTSGCGRQVRP